MRNTLVLAAFLVAAPAALQAQSRAAGTMIAAEQEAMNPLAWMDGVWRGEGAMTTTSGRHAITQTERVGPFLGGSVKVIEGRGYNPDGSVGFNALGIVSYNPMTKAWSMHSYAQGFSGDFPITVSERGFAWDQPAGPGAVIRYTTTLENGAWHEVGDRVAGGGAPVRIFEMTLKRIGATSWPAEGAVPMR